MKVPLLNFIGGPGVPLWNFEGGPGVRLLNFRGLPSPILNFVAGVQGPGSQSSEVLCPEILIPLLHHAQSLELVCSYDG